MAYRSQSKQNASLGFEVQVLKIFYVAPSSPERGFGGYSCAILARLRALWSGYEFGHLLIPSRYKRSIVYLTNAR